MPGATLTSERLASSSSTQGHGGRPAGHVEDPTAATAPGRVGEGGVEPVDVDRGRVADHARRRPVRGRRGWPRPSPPAPGPGRSRPRSARPGRTARRSPPIPQPRSMTLPPGIAAARRAARWSATRVRVACSSASGVKNMTGAAAPNFATAFARSCACVVAAAAFSASGSRRRTTLATRTGSPGWSAQAWLAWTRRRSPSLVRSQSSVSISTGASCQADRPRPR